MALSKSLVEVGISMVLKDQFSANAGKISSSYSNMMNNMMQWNRGIQMQAGNAYDYGQQIVGGMYEAYQHSAKVGKQIFLTSQIAGATAKQQESLLKLAQQVNLQTPLTNMDIGSGMKYMAMAGNSAEAIEHMIGPAARLASIFEMDLGGKGGVADMMTNIMATFGIASKDAANVANILGKATTSANISLSDLAQSLEYSGATFRNAGVDLTSASAAIGVLGNQGIQGSGAGTALANMYRYLTLSITGQKTKGAGMLKALGISKDELVDSYGNLRRVDQIVQVFTKHMQGLTGVQKEQVFYNIFGVRGMRAISALMAGQDQLTQVLSEVEQGSGGFTEETLQKYLNTADGIINTFTSTIDNLKTNTGYILANIFNPVLRLLSGASTLVNEIANTGVGGWIIRFTSVTAIIGLIVNGFRLIHRTITMIKSVTLMANAAVGGMATGTAKVNGQVTMLETHLRTIVALMAQYTAMSLAPGTTMAMPFGGVVIGRGKNRKVYAQGKDGTRMSIGEYAAGYGRGATTTGGSAAGAAVGAAARGWRGKLGGLGKLAGAGLTMFGGPWGMAIGLGITALSYALTNSDEATKENTDALNKNTNEMTSEEVRARYQEKFINAFKEAMKETNRDPLKVNIQVDGRDYGIHSTGEQVDIDDFGY